MVVLVVSLCSDTFFGFLSLKCKIFDQVTGNVLFFSSFKFFKFAGKLQIIPDWFLLEKFPKWQPVSMNFIKQQTEEVLRFCDELKGSGERFI